jgi:hypothetical protein
MMMAFKVVVSVIMMLFFTAASGKRQTLFSPTMGTTAPTFADNKPIELGVRFSSSVAGNVLGVRFYK